MSDLQRYIDKRSALDPEFAKDFEEGYQDFKIGVLLRHAREAAGLTQEDVARRLSIQRSAVSKVENNAEQVRLSLLKRYAKVLGKTLHVSLA